MNETKLADEEVKAREKRRLQARWLDDATPEHEWGVVVDDLGSAEMIGNRQEAIGYFIEHGGLALMRITTHVYSLPERCPIDVGSRPGWMGEVGSGE